MLNQQTQLDIFPIPRIANMQDKLGQASMFSTIDLANAYHQACIHEPHIHRTAFLMPFGQYEFTVLPFGLTDAPSAFQRIMHTIFSGMTGNFVLVYLDNILIYSKDESEHLEYIKAVLQHLRDKQFKAKRSKCKLAVDAIKYMGHIISKGKVSVDLDQTDAIHSWPAPTCIKEAQQFLGLPNYYNQFVKYFVQIASPLTKLLQKGIDFVQSLECQFAFQQLKDQLCSNPVLHLLDFQRPFVIETDCSDSAVGAAIL